MLIQSAKSILRYNQEAIGTWARHLAACKGFNLATIAAARKLIVACWYLMHGRFTKMEDIPRIVADKIRELSVYIPANDIKKMGFSSKKAFIQNRLQLLMQTS